MSRLGGPFSNGPYGRIESHWIPLIMIGCAGDAVIMIGCATGRVIAIGCATGRVSTIVGIGGAQLGQRPTAARVAPISRRVALSAAVTVR